MNFFNNFGKTISEFGQTTIQKGKDMAEIARLNSSIAEEERNIDSLYQEMGRMYEVRFGIERPDPDFAEVLDRIKEAKEKIKGYEQKIKVVKGIGQCPHCGADVPSTSAFCPSCGQKIEFVPEPAEEPAWEAPTPENKPEEKRCQYCGEVLTPFYKFCTSCGKPVPEEVEPAVEEEKTGAEEAEPAQSGFTFGEVPVSETPDVDVDTEMNEID